MCQFNSSSQPERTRFSYVSHPTKASARRCLNPPTMGTAGTLRSSWTTTTTSSSVRPWRSSKFFSTSCQLFLSGEHAETLKKQCFTDAKKTNCLEAIKFVANLVWNGETNFAFLSISIINTILLRVPGEAGPQPP